MTFATAFRTMTQPSLSRITISLLMTSKQPQHDPHVEHIVDADDFDEPDTRVDSADATGATVSPAESTSAASALMLTRRALAAAGNAIGDGLVAEDDDEPADDRVRRVMKILFAISRNIDESPDGEKIRTAWSMSAQTSSSLEASLKQMTGPPL